MKKINNVLITGCSATSGFMYQDNPNDPRIWAQQICSRLFPEATVVNRAETGRNNDWIFLETMSALCKNHYDLVIVQWTKLLRINLTFGLETWNTTSLLDGSRDVDLHNNIVVSARWQEFLGDNIRSMSNFHWSILNVVKYVNILIQLQNSRNQKIFFVNAAAEWPNNYFNKQEQLTVKTDLPPFVQKMLEVSSRTDKEVFEIYDMIHNQYQEYGSIRPEYWINLYEPMTKLKIDTVSDTDQHPGHQSQSYLADLFAPILLEKLQQE